MRTPPRDPASSMVIPSSPARSSACRRDTRRIAQRHLNAPIAAEARGQQRDATPRSARAAHADPPPGDQAGGDAGGARVRRRRLLHAGLRQQRCRRERGAALAAGQQRFESADGVDGRPPVARSLLVARERRFHPVEIAERAPRVRRARLLAQVFVGQRGPPVIPRAPQQPGGPAQGPPFELGERRAAAAGRTAPPPRRCGPRPARPLPPRRPGWYGVGRLFGLAPGPRPASVSASTREAVSRSVSDTYATSCSLAPTAPNSDVSASQFCSRQRRPTRPTKSRPPRIVSSGSSVCRRGATPRCYRMTRRFSDGLPR